MTQIIIKSNCGEGMIIDACIGGLTDEYLREAAEAYNLCSQGSEPEQFNIQQFVDDEGVAYWYCEFCGNSGDFVYATVWLSGDECKQIYRAALEGKHVELDLFDWNEDWNLSCDLDN